MASITKRGEYQYQAMVRRKGYPTQIETFETRGDAEVWARGVESEMDTGKFRDPKLMASTTLGDALDRYSVEVTPGKRGAAIELQLIKRLKRHPLAMRSMGSLLAADFASYRIERLNEVGNNTVRIELALFSHLFTMAIKEWSWPIEHLPRNITKPSPGKGRKRRLMGDEEARLFAAILDRPLCKAPVGLNACVRLAIETGMRAGEILSLAWEQVDIGACVIRLDITKNGCERVVGLTSAAVDVLKSLPRIGNRVIANFYDTCGLDHAFKRACNAAGIVNLRFHDLRHEAASRFAAFMTAPELAKTMGWKTLEMAMRYYNPRDEEKVEIVRRREKAMAPAKAKAARQAWGVSTGAASSALAPTFAIPTAAMLVPTQVTFMAGAYERVASVAVDVAEPARVELKKAA